MPPEPARGGWAWLARAWIPLAIFTLAAGLRLYLFPSFLRQGTAGDFFSNGPVFSKYPWIAAKIVQHAALGDRILDFSPLYTLLVTVLAELFPDKRIAWGLFQILLGSSSCVLVYRAAALISNRRTAVIAGVVALVYGPFLLYECVLEPEILIIFLNLASLVLLLACVGKRRNAWWFLPGATLGLSFITRPNLLVFMLCALAWLFLTFRRSPQRLAAILAWLGAGLCITIAPVLVRNYLLSGSVLAPLMSSGQVLYQGNNPTAKGFYGSHPYLLKEMEVDPAINRDYEPDFAHELYRQFAGKPPAPSAAASSPGATALAAETESFWYERSRAFARQHPAAFFRLLGEKFRAFWSAYEIHDVLPLYDLEWRMNRLPLLSFGVVVPFALLGMCLAAQDFKRHLLLYGFVLNYLVSNLMFFVTARQRLLALPFLVIFAAIAVSRGSDALRSGLKSCRLAGTPERLRLLLGIVAGVAVLFGFTFAVNLPSPPLEHFATFLHLNRDSQRSLAQAMAAIDAGDLVGARSRFQRSFDLLPFQATRVPNKHLGGAPKKYAAAIRFWENVLARKSDNGYARFTLGYLFFRSGDYGRALRELRPLADSGEDLFLGYLLPIAQPRFYVARCLEEQGDTAGAIAAYERLERERPGLPWVAARRLVLAQIAGDDGTARALGSALDRLDNPISTAYLLAVAYRDRGLYDKAIRTLEQAPRQLLDRYAPYHFLLSACYAQQAGRAGPERGREAVGAAIRECRNGLKLGTHLNELHPETVSAYQAALALDPGDPQLSYELGIVFFALGDLEQARLRLLTAISSRMRPLPEAAEQAAQKALEEIAALGKAAA